MSTKTGVAPAWRMTLTVALKLKLTVMTSSPGPIPRARRIASLGHRPVAHHHRVAHAAVRRPRPPRTRRSACPSPACRSAGRRGRPPPRPGRCRAWRSGSRAGLHGMRRDGACRRRHVIDTRVQRVRRRWSSGAAAGTASRALGVRSDGRPDESGRRWPQAHTQPRRRAGLPATSAWSGTARVTTAPAPTVANRPTSCRPRRPRRRRSSSRAQQDGADRPVVGAARARPSAVMLRGKAVVGQDRVRADEDAVLDGDPVVDEGAVLDLARGRRCGRRSRCRRPCR